MPFWRDAFFWRLKWQMVGCPARRCFKRFVTRRGRRGGCSATFFNFPGPCFGVPPAVIFPAFQVYGYIHHLSRCQIELINLISPCGKTHFLGVLGLCLHNKLLFFPLTLFAHPRLWREDLNYFSFEVHCHNRTILGSLK